MISLCVIVRDEEKNLDRCLSSVNNFVNEIIIVDTGSKDNTKYIAKKYTDKIYDFKWENDFSKARNFSIEKANYEWILILDADEIITKFNRQEIDNFIKFKKDVLGRIDIINLISDKNGVKKSKQRVARLFNKNYFRYKGKIHEQLEKKDSDYLCMEDIDIEVEHVGYDKKINNLRYKLNRNIELLLVEIENNDTDPYLYYQLGKSYYMGEFYDMAEKQFEIAIKYVTDYRYEYIEDLIETYGYTLLSLGKYEKALKIIDYESYLCDSADFYFLKGLICMNNGYIYESIKSFEIASNKEKYKVEGVNSYLTFYNLGVIYECLGDINKAIEYYNKSGDYHLSKSRLDKLMTKV
ncbi:glycosyltransferase [Caloramator sp. ALD01]|uniref:tetratricopeptide repeat-containing glycosyltransferase family 2 protein n=1 Tax=Caloramator sp. ALD01 TaxID=1031288 RepID=UPI000415A4AB|nr:glycosyltransferase [Caloramator sp. ALD01]